MMKTMCFWLCAVALTCTATTGFAQIDIGNFDDGTTSGWGANSASVINLASTDYDSAIHATTPNNALNLFMAPASGFQWAIQLDNNDIANLGSLLAANPILQADVSWRSDEWSSDPDGAWVRWDQVSINSAAGWMQTVDADITDSANPGSPGGWDPVNWGESHQRTMTWDLRTAIGANGAALAASPWVQLNMSVNFDGAFNTGAGYSFWIDSARLLPADVAIPEPASLALVGLCSACALLARRR